MRKALSHYLYILLVFSGNPVMQQNRLKCHFRPFAEYNVTSLLLPLLCFLLCRFVCLTAGLHKNYWTIFPKKKDFLFTFFNLVSFDILTNSLGNNCGSWWNNWNLGMCAIRCSWIEFKGTVPGGTCSAEGHSCCTCIFMTQVSTDLLLVQYFHGEVLLCWFVFHQHDSPKRASTQGL